MRSQNHLAWLLYICALEYLRLNSVKLGLPVGEMEGSRNTEISTQVPMLRFRVEKSRPMAGSSPWLPVRATVQQGPTTIIQTSSGYCLTLGEPHDVKPETLLARPPVSPSLGLEVCHTSHSFLCEFWSPNSDPWTKNFSS